jgi:hypothetical protein
MDEKDHQTSRSGTGSAPIGVSAVRPPAGSQDGSTVTYYGDAARVREGFAIALGLLGFSAPMVDDVTRDRSEDGE